MRSMPIEMQTYTLPKRFFPLPIPNNGILHFFFGGKVPSFTSAGVLGQRHHGRNLRRQCDFQGTGEGGTGAGPGRPLGEARDIQRAAQAPLDPPRNSSPGPSSEPPGPGPGRDPVTVGPTLTMKCALPRNVRKEEELYRGCQRTSAALQHPGCAVLCHCQCCTAGKKIS
jgi:hypothetical protein